MDFEDAFPNGLQRRPAFTEFPKEMFPKEKELNCVTKPKISLDGLKYVEKLWNQLLLEVLNERGFKETETACCFFIRR